ncbi:MAG: hypothetical protein PHY34_02825 [Patescibacteria group bacterium]|nr:hypothetical protein [Patescibacteria group bacterium]MDD5715392.1 hypothetical protein [Patescibacteria group bacterium]
MKKLLFGIILFALGCMLCPRAAAQHPGSQPKADTAATLTIDDIRLELGQGRLHRYLGDDDRGVYWERSLDLYISSGHRTLASFSLTSEDFSGTDLSFMSANVQTRSLGFAIPIRTVTVRLVDNNWVDQARNSSVDAGGAYLEWKPRQSTYLEAGGELFYRKPIELLYTFGVEWFKKPMLFKGLSLGFSHRNVHEDGVAHANQDLVEAGAIIPVGPAEFGIGASTRTDTAAWNDGSRAYMVSCAVPVPFNAGAWQPGGYACYFEKPASQRVMVMGSFGGAAFNPKTIEALQESGFRNLLTPTRIVNNQMFYISALNEHSQEFGRIAYYFVWVRADITEDVRIDSYKGSMYLTAWDWKRGCLGKPFVGYTYEYEDDVTFNMRQRRLESVGHANHALEAGIRLRLFDNADTSFERGWVRFNVVGMFSHSHMEGVGIRATMWLL